MPKELCLGTTPAWKLKDITSCHCFSSAVLLPVFKSLVYIPCSYYFLCCGLVFSVCFLCPSTLPVFVVFPPLCPALISFTWSCLCALHCVQQYVCVLCLCQLILCHPVCMCVFLFSLLCNLICISLSLCRCSCKTFTSQSKATAAKALRRASR